MRSRTADAYIEKIAERKTPYFKTIAGIELRIDEGVYPTGTIGALFHEALELLPFKISKNTKALDYGTGTGFLSILTALQGATVVSLDISLTSIECAKFNAEKNQVSHLIDFRVSNYLSSLKQDECFDLILAGLPWDDAKPDTPLEQGFYDEDFKMRKALCKNLSKILNPGGLALLTYSKHVQEINPIEKFFPNCQVSVLLEENINDEPHYILTVRPVNH